MSIANGVLTFRETVKVKKKAKIMNRYNKVPDLTKTQVTSHTIERRGHTRNNKDKHET